MQIKKSVGFFGTLIALFLIIAVTLLVYAQSQGFTVTSVSTSSVITKSTDPATVYWIINREF